jgi:hypothetical protein
MSFIAHRPRIFDHASTIADAVELPVAVRRRARRDRSHAIDSTILTSRIVDGVIVSVTWQTLARFCQRAFEAASAAEPPRPAAHNRLIDRDWSIHRFRIPRDRNVSRRGIDRRLDGRAPAARTDSTAADSNVSIERHRFPSRTPGYRTCAVRF